MQNNRDLGQFLLEGAGSVIIGSHSGGLGVAETMDSVMDHFVTPLIESGESFDAFKELSDGSKSRRITVYVTDGVVTVTQNDEVICDYII